MSVKKNQQMEWYNANEARKKGFPVKAKIPDKTKSTGGSYIDIWYIYIKKKKWSFPCVQCK